MRWVTLSQALILLDDSQRDYALAILQSHAAPPTGVASTGNSRTGLANGHAVVPAGAPQPPPLDDKLYSLISHVRDILPDYGEGFVAACLAKFDNDAERVRNAMEDQALGLRYWILEDAGERGAVGWDGMGWIFWDAGLKGCNGLTA